MPRADRALSGIGSGRGYDCSSRPVATRKDETAAPLLLSPTNPGLVIAVTDF